MLKSKQMTAKLSFRELINKRLSLESDVTNSISFAQFENAVKKGIDDAANEIEELLRLHVSLSKSKTDIFLNYSITNAFIESCVRLLAKRNKINTIGVIESKGKSLKSRKKQSPRRRPNNLNHI